MSFPQSAPLCRVVTRFPPIAQKSTLGLVTLGQCSTPRHHLQELFGKRLQTRMASTTSADATTGGDTAQPSKDIDASSLVMQLVVDSALIKIPEWTLGPMMAQAAHATSAVLAQTLQQSSTTAYLSAENLLHMRKIVLKTSSSTTLQSLSDHLAKAALLARENNESFPDHHLWIEQPENIPTVIAIAPNSRPPALKKVLNKCSLLRD